ncbi:MAG: hypothetical protein LBT85_00205 [Bifidobacteriaceae bacterium]|nr:hypothetical protein [Bifidobacteriaceae bacterium]
MSNNFELAQKNKENNYGKNKNIQADLLNICLVNFNRLRSFGAGVICLERNYYLVCVAIILQKFVWQISEIGVVLL